MNKPMFQRRHYEALAGLIRSLKDLEGQGMTISASEVEFRLLGALLRDNPQFDATRFTKACHATDAEAAREAEHASSGHAWLDEPRKLRRAR
jgi:hypothetical protein